MKSCSLVRVIREKAIVHVYYISVHIALQCGWNIFLNPMEACWGMFAGFCGYHLLPIEGGRLQPWGPKLPVGVPVSPKRWVQAQADQRSIAMVPSLLIRPNSGKDFGVGSPSVLHMCLTLL